MLVPLQQRYERDTGIFLHLLAAPCAPSTRLLQWLCSVGWPVWKVAPRLWTTLPWAGAHLHVFKNKKGERRDEKNISLFNKTMDNPHPYCWANFTTSLKKPTHIPPICLCYPPFFINMHASIMAANYILIGWHGWMCAGGKRGQKHSEVKLETAYL